MEASDKLSVKFVLKSGKLTSFGSFCDRLCQKLKLTQWNEDFTFTYVSNDTALTIYDDDSWIQLIETIKITQNETICLVLGKKECVTEVDFEPPNILNPDKSLSKRILFETNRLDCNLIGTEMNSNSESELEMLYDYVKQRSKLFVEKNELKAELGKEFESINMDLSSECSDYLDERFDHLLNLLEKDGIGTDHSNYKLVADSREQIGILNWEKAFKLLDKVMSQMKPFDIEMAYKLYTKTESAAQKVAGKDIVLMLGHTGMFVIMCFVCCVVRLLAIFAMCFFLTKYKHRSWKINDNSFFVWK